MTLLKKCVLVALGSLVTACAMPEAATRNTTLSPSPIQITGAAPAVFYDLQNVSMFAPADIVVSEGNGFYPNADVVWRGDPLGDRVAQIMSMFDTALERASADWTGDVPVTVDIELVRFHGVTERTRFTVGGNYDIHFYMTVRHAETFEVLEERRLVELDLAAPGGAAALLLEQRGQTEKVRVTDFLTYVFDQNLSGPIQL